MLTGGEGRCISPSRVTFHRSRHNNKKIKTNSRGHFDKGHSRWERELFFILFHLSCLVLQLNSLFPSLFIQGSVHSSWHLVYFICGLWTPQVSKRRSLPISFRENLLSNSSSLNKRSGTLEILHIKNIESSLQNNVSLQKQYSVHKYNFCSQTIFLLRFFGSDILMLTDQPALPLLISRGVFALMHEIAGDPLHVDV